MTGAELAPLELAGRLALAFGLAVFLGLAFEEVYKREDRSSSRRGKNISDARRIWRDALPDRAASRLALCAPALRAATEGTVAASPG